MTQLNLPLGRSSLPAVRRVRTTSIAAHREIELTGVDNTQRAVVLALVKAHPGNTSRDLADYTDALDAYQIARRLTELRDRGIIRNGDNAVTANSGRGGMTWWPV